MSDDLEEITIDEEGNGLVVTEDGKFREIIPAKLLRKMDEPVEIVTQHSSDREILSGLRMGANYYSLKQVGETTTSVTFYERVSPKKDFTLE